MRRGDTAAFAHIYERHKEGIYGYCLRLLRNKKEAEDAAQEVFLKMRQGIGGLDKKAAFRSWLFAIAHNTVFSMMKKSQPDLNLNEDEAIDLDSPYEKAIQHDSREILDSLVSSLKPTYREVLLLREYEGLSYEEIAETIGMPLSAVKARILKARRALAKMFHRNYRRDDVC